MNLDFTCIGSESMKPKYWNGQIYPIKLSNPYEIAVTARESCFHIICGSHSNGNYLCIPNWNIGSELADFSDYFWNLERLTTYYPELSKVDAISIATALAKLSEYISISKEAG